jgi:hypothetical protein
MWQDDWKKLNKEGKQNYRMKERNKARQNNTRKEIKGQRKTERKKEEKKRPNQSYLSQLPPLIECGLQ